MGFANAKPYIDSPVSLGVVFDKYTCISPLRSCKNRVRVYMHALSSVIPIRYYTQPMPSDNS